MKSNRRSPPPRKGNLLLLGIIIGTLIGVGIAVGVALFLTRAPSPFNQSQQASIPPDTIASAVKPADSKPEIMHPNGSSTVEGIAEASSVSMPAAVNASQPQSIDYDFYKVLSGNEEKKKKDTSTPEPIKSPDATETSKLGMVKKSYLQFGAFQSEQQADNMKARLALVGVEAQIQSKENGTTILHRVRVGPFTSQEELIRLRNQLKQNGIDSTIVTG
jgi:cell division protein FtsN